LREQRQIAYTTVMTVMNNLVKKELLTQDRTSIAYVYTRHPGNEVPARSSTACRASVPRPSNVALSHILGLQRDLSPEQAEALRKYAQEHFAA